MFLSHFYDIRTITKDDRWFQLFKQLSEKQYNAKFELDTQQFLLGSFVSRSLVSIRTSLFPPFLSIYLPPSREPSSIPPFLFTF